MLTREYFGESGGDLALVLAGSAVNGVHSYLTDMDFIFIPTVTPMSWFWKRCPALNPARARC